LKRNLPRAQTTPIRKRKKTSSKPIILQMPLGDAIVSPEIYSITGKPQNLAKTTHTVSVLVSCACHNKMRNNACQAACQGLPGLSSAQYRPYGLLHDVSHTHSKTSVSAIQQYAMGKSITSNPTETQLLRFYKLSIIEGYKTEHVHLEGIPDRAWQAIECCACATLFWLTSLVLSHLLQHAFRM
jgi:hypothetical protein